MAERVRMEYGDDGQWRVIMTLDWREVSIVPPDSWAELVLIIGPEVDPRVMIVWAKDRRFEVWYGRDDKTYGATVFLDYEEWNRHYTKTEQEMGANFARMWSVGKYVSYQLGGQSLNDKMRQLLSVWADVRELLEPGKHKARL